MPSGDVGTLDFCMFPYLIVCPKKENRLREFGDEQLPSNEDSTSSGASGHVEHEEASSI